jgi:molybdopterin/thiamine biosynthesis adenylyltransferase
MTLPAWNYDEAFSRNLGLVTAEEQDQLKRTCVAICGLGGVGGVHLVTLLRLGIGRFRLAEPDRFEPANMNRQYGASMRTVGRAKLEVMAEVARSINPEVELTLFDEGLTADNAREVFKGAEVAVDGIDFFAIHARRLFFQTARQAGMYALTSAPLGFGATLHVFSPTGMSFDDYFDIADRQSVEDQLAAFAVGLAPRALHLPYMDLSRVSFTKGVGPSSMIACQLASALIGAETLNLILKRSPPRVAPCYLQVDAYRRRLAVGYLWLGNRNLLQRLKRRLFKRRLAKLDK